MTIVKRLVKGSALTHAELDGNFTDLDTRVGTLENTTDSDNQTLTLVGTDLSISDGNTVDLSSLGGGTGGIALTDLSVTSLAAAGSGTLTYDNTTGVFDYTPPDLSSFSTFDGDYNSLTNKPTIPSVLTDLGITDGTNGQVLTTDGAGSFTFTTVTGGGGTTYDQSLNTTDAVQFASVTTDALVVQGVGNTTITSGADVELDSPNRVKVTQSPFRLAQLTTAQRDAIIPDNGDMIYNTDTNRIEAVVNGVWVIVGTSAIV